MKKKISIAALGLAFTTTAFTTTAHAQQADAPTAATTENAPAAQDAPALSPEEVKARTSYGIGYQSAIQLANAGLLGSDFDNTAFLDGFTQALAGAELKFTPEQLDAAMQALQASLIERDKKIGEENLKVEKTFLEANAKKEGITTTKSGLQYQVIEKGGEEKYVAPKDAPGGIDLTTEFYVNYRGTLIDGTEFDKSPEGEPVPFNLQVIPGFAEALQMMPVGAKWKIFIPAALGYGETRSGAKLGPNSTLIFDVELTKLGKRELPQGMPFGMPQGHPGQ